MAARRPGAFKRGLSNKNPDNIDWAGLEGKLGLKQPTVFGVQKFSDEVRYSNWGFMAPKHLRLSGSREWSWSHRSLGGNRAQSTGDAYLLVGDLGLVAFRFCCFWAS